MQSIKDVLLDMVIAGLGRKLETAAQGKSDAIEESKAHKGAMESRYDTFKEEAQALADGFSGKIHDLEVAIVKLQSLKSWKPAIERVSVYAIVEVEELETGSREKYFLLPAGGGETYEVDDEKITALSLDAPLARAFIGKEIGDEAEMRLQSSVKQFEIISIS